MSGLAMVLADLLNATVSVVLGSRLLHLLIGITVKVTATPQAGAVMGLARI